MKNLLFTIISFCLVLNLNAQDDNTGSSFFDSILFGIKAGPTFSTSGSGSIESNDGRKDGGRTQVSFHLGATAELKLTDNLSFQTELLYSSEKSKTTKEEKYNASYIQIPLLLKFYFAKGFSIEAGPQIGFLVSSDLNFDDTFNPDRYIILDKLKSTEFRVTGGLAYKFNNGISVGGRYDIYLTDPKAVNTDDSDGYIPTSYSIHRNGLISAYVGYSFN